MVTLRVRVHCCELQLVNMTDKALNTGTRTNLKADGSTDATDQSR